MARALKQCVVCALSTVKIGGFLKNFSWLQMLTLIVLLIQFLFFGEIKAESNTPKTLSFVQWKQQQITASENRQIRLANSITLVKSTTGDMDELNKLEVDLRVANQNVLLVKELTIEDYFNVYLSQFSDKDSALIDAARTMSKEEVGSLLKILLRARTNSANSNFEGRSKALFVGLAG